MLPMYMPLPTPDSSDSGIIGSVVSPEFDQFHKYFKQPNDDIIGAIVSTVRKYS